MSSINSDKDSSDQEQQQRIETEKDILLTPLININNQEEDKMVNKTYVDDFLKPLPILPRGSAYQEGAAIPKKHTFDDFKQNSENLDKIGEDQDFLEEDTISNTDEDVKKKKVNIPLEEKNKQKKKNNIKSSKEVQEKLQQYADQIRLQNNVQIDKDKHPNFFKYPIYDSYKPSNLCETRKLLQIYLRNSVAGIKNENLEREQFREFYNYSINQMDTKIPSFINQNTLLQFDSHFECGNLDSVYLVQENEYNLLMKVDTNTKGNSFWFYFKVNNGRPGQVVKFNILNFSRDLKHFYAQGMNICVQREKDEKEQIWQQDKCFNIQFSQSSELVKSTGKNNSSFKYYHELTFKYQFEATDDGQIGNGIYFAYSIPFTYSQLIGDLQLVKNNLMLQPHLIKKIGLDIGVKSSTESLALDLKNQGRQRLNQFELQHLEIRNQGLKLMKLNSLEKAILNEQNSVTDFDQNVQDATMLNRSKNNNNFYKDEFEIKSGNLLYKQEIMAYSVGGLPIYQLTVTGRCGHGQLKYKKRKVIYICARVHAGETNASYIMQNIIFELANTSTNKYDQLLQNYIIKLVPMINVDGVTIGNGRASLVGLDLNRRWTNPNPLIHPEVFFLKKMLKKFNTQYEKGVQIFCDLHGHNRKLNSFVYGCHKAANAGLLSWTKTRLIPKIFASITQLFNYRDCRFKIDKCKLNTARVVCWNELKITNSFTLEASLYGKQDSSKQEDGYQEIKQMTIKDYHDLGESFLNSIAQYNNLEPELEQEFQQTNGWLKVSKLNDVTGKAARDKVQEENNLTMKKSQRIKKTLLAHQQNIQNTKLIEIRHRKSFIETAYNTNSNKQQQTVVNQVAVQNQQLMNRKQSFAISTTTASGNNQISAIKNQNNKNGLKQNIKSAKVKMDKFQKRKTSSNKNMIRSGSSLNDDDSVSNSSKSTLMYHSSIGSNWRDFFDQKEIDKVINLAQQNQILEEENEESESDQDMGGSDSDPSEDNIDQTEFYEMISTVFKKEDQVSFDELLPQISQNQDLINIQDQNDAQKGFERQSSQANLQLADDELDYQPLTYQEIFPLQSPPYNFKRRNQDEYQQNDQYYDLQLQKQIQTNRIKHLQVQLEDLERQKKQQLMLQQHLNQSQSSENQLNISVSQYKNPVTNQASKTAYLGWNITKNKMSSANLSQNSNQNFQDQKQYSLLQKSPEKIRNPIKNPVLQHNGRLMSSNLFDPNKQKLITDQALAQARQLAAQKKLDDDSQEQSKEQLNHSSGFWQMRNRGEKHDPKNNNIFAQMGKPSSVSPEKDRGKYAIKVNMVVNEIERLNKNIGRQEHLSHNDPQLIRSSVIIPDQKIITQIGSFKTQQSFFLSPSKNIQTNLNQSIKYVSSIKQEDQLKLIDAQLADPYQNEQPLNNSLYEYKTPNNHLKNTISPVMFKRFENKFQTTIKKDDHQYLKTDSKSPINLEKIQSDYYQSPNHQHKESSTNKLLPQIVLSRAQTQITSRKQTSHEGSSANVNQIYKQERQQQNARLNLNNPYQSNHIPTLMHTPLQQSSGTGVIAHNHKTEHSVSINQQLNMTFQENKIMNQSFQNEHSPQLHQSDLFPQNSKQIKSQQDYARDSKSLYKQQIEKFKQLEEELKHMNKSVKESRKPPKFNHQQNIFLQTLIKSNRKQMPSLLDLKQRQ